MRKYIIFANLILAIAVIFLGMKTYDSAKELLGRKGINVPVKHSNRKDTTAKKYSRTSLMTGPRHSANYYAVIPKNNLFRPERKEYEEHSSPEKKKAPTAKKDVPPPAIDLYGIMIDNKKKVALIYDKREKEQNLRYKVVSTGDEIQGYTIVRIATERIIVEKGGRKATIKLSQAKAARGGIMATEKKVPSTNKKTEAKAKKVTRPGSGKKITAKRLSSTSPGIEIKKEGTVTYQIIRTPGGVKKVRIN